MDVKKLLEKIKSNETSIDEALDILSHLPYEELEFAKLDHHRQLRKGCGEVIYSPGKTNEQLVQIIKCFHSKGANILATRTTQEQFLAVKEIFETIEYDPVSKVLKLIQNKITPMGKVAVCCAGTGDLPVAEEAAQTAEFFGSNVERFCDIGIAGIHRLFSKYDEIKTANAIVAVAGMEGALSGVLAGLFDIPVIAVPTSVGYGASFGGIAPLLTMLNSCAEGIAVVNIDNGFGAGYMACQINRKIVQK